MTRFRKHGDLWRLVSLIVGSTSLCACMTWEPQSLQPERFRTADSTQSVRLILRRGDTLVVSSPVIIGDSLVGLRSRSGAPPDSLDRFSVPLAAVSEAQMKKQDRAATAMVGILVLVGFAAAVGATHPCISLCSGR